MTTRTGPFLTILRLLLVVSGLAALGYAPSMVRSAQAEAVTLTEARLAPAAPSLRPAVPDLPKGDPADLALPAGPVTPLPPQVRLSARLLPQAALLPGRDLPAPRARAPPLA